jgi:hypothetical protein
MKGKNCIKTAIVVLLLISSVTLLPTTLSKTTVSNNIAKKIHFKPYNYKKISINPDKIIDNFRELIKNKAFRKDVRNACRFLVERNVKGIVKELLENKINTAVFQEKISKLLSNSAVKTLFDKYYKKEALGEGLAILLIIIGILVAAAWGGALGTLILPGIGTIIGAVLSGCAAWLTTVPAGLWTLGHFFYAPFIVQATITAILVAIWPVFWIIFFIGI